MNLKLYTTGLVTRCPLIAKAQNLPALFLFFLFLFTPFSRTLAQSPFNGHEALFTQPRHYIAYFTEKGPHIDGDLRDPVWENAPWSEKFVDIEGEHMPKPTFDTRVKMLWNDTSLFIAAELQEPHVWASLKEHDQVVFHDNDFEVFIEPGNDTHQYFEIEVNAFNTIFDLFMSKPYRNGSGALINWHADGLRSAVQVQGSLNDARGTDQGWTVEMAIPFSAISLGNHAQVPEDGSLWRMNFSRVQWDTEVKDGAYIKLKGADGRPLPEHNWVWSPQGIINMHYPERWGYLQFSRQKSVSPGLSFSLPYAEKQKAYLWLIYYKQMDYFRKHGRYAASLADLNLKKQVKVMIGDRTNHLILEAGPHQFMALIQEPELELWSINQEGFIQKLK
jgi:hypothetical protein